MLLVVSVDGIFGTSLQGLRILSHCHELTGWRVEQGKHLSVMFSAGEYAVSKAAIRRIVCNVNRTRCRCTVVMRGHLRVAAFRGSVAP